MPVYQHQHNHHISHHHHLYLDGSGLTCGSVIVGKSLDQLSQYISRCGRGDPFPLNGQDEDFGKILEKITEHGCHRQSTQLVFHHLGVTWCFHLFIFSVLFPMLPILL